MFPTFCKYVFSFTQQSLITWNRLLPVGIVLYRYMLVCHAITCQNLGGERTIPTTVSRGLIVVSLGSGVVVLWNISTSFTYSRCINREETFW